MKDKYNFGKQNEPNDLVKFCKHLLDLSKNLSSEMYPWASCKINCLHNQKSDLAMPRLSTLGDWLIIGYVMSSVNSRYGSGSEIKKLT